MPEEIAEPRASLQAALSDFLAALGPDEVAPAAGPVAALVALLATLLAELTARLAGEDELVAEARRLGAEIAPLARLDAEAYEEFLATRAPGAREQTIELPARLAELAAETAEAAAAAAERGRTSSRADAAAGALLGEAAAKAAALLVAVNAGSGDARLERSRELVERASAAARRAEAAARQHQQ